MAKLLSEAAAGVYVIAVTPFTDSLEIDFSSLDRMTDFYLDCGVDGLTLLGIMGEAPKLSGEESQSVVNRVLGRVAGRVPVIVGVSSPGFAAMRELASAVMDAGAAGVMVAPPHKLRTDDGIAGYYNNVAEVLGRDVPFVLQDYPLATGVQIAPPVISRIVREVPSCVMLKHEDWPGLGKITAVRCDSEKGHMRRISILTGNGGLFLPNELARGVDGVMTGFCFPEMMVAVCKTFGSGDVDLAFDLFDAYLPLVRYEQQPEIGLAVRKYVMTKRGVIASAAQRDPAIRLSPSDIADIERLLARQTRRLSELTPISARNEFV